MFNDILDCLDINLVYKTKLISKHEIYSTILSFMLYYKRIGLINGSVAQRLEQGTHKPKVVGSNPTRASR